MLRDRLEQYNHYMSNFFKETLEIHTHGKGLYPFTEKVNQAIQRWQAESGMCYLFCQHTSASLLINENYDPTARIDLEAFLEHLAPENQSWYRHTLEGADDSPAHLRTALTPTSLTIPIDNHRLTLGAWQGIYLFEHRTYPETRRVLLRVLQE
jgi:secondary thiamine-phosphate synthase enzyme